MMEWEKKRDQEFQAYMDLIERFDPREDCCEEHAYGEAPDGFWDWYIRQDDAPVKLVYESDELEG